MSESRPEAHRIAEEAQFVPGHAHEFGKHDVHGDQVGVPAIGPGGIDEVGPEAAHARVPPAPQVIGGQPPQKIEEVRTGQLRNPVPAHAREVHVLDALAVNVDFVIRRQARDPFGDAPLGSVAFVDEGRNNGDPDGRHSLGALPTG